MTYVFRKLTSPQKVASGVAEKLLYAPVADFDTIAVPTAPFTNPGDSITIAGDHTFNAGKGFMEIALAPQKNSVDEKTRGDIGLKGLNSELKVFVPGSYKEAHELVENMLNVPMIFIIKDSESVNEDEYYQLGNASFGAYLDVNFKTGTTKDGQKGFDGTITFDSGLNFYTGVVTTI